MKKLRSLLAVLFLLALIPALQASKPTDPVSGQWTTLGNGAGHTGFYPWTIGNAPISAGWSKTVGAGLNQVAVSGNQVFVTAGPYFSGSMFAASLDITTGKELWRYPMASTFSINGPTVDNGRVFFQRCDNYNDTFLYALDRTNGGLLWASPFAAQWEHYQAPTVVGDGVWIEGGSYGGMYGFNVADGGQRFFVPLPQEDNWTPSYYDGVVYSCVSGILKACDPRTGSDLWTRDIKPAGATWYQGSVPVILNGRASIVASGTLVTIDLNTKTVAWSKAENFAEIPATDGSAVYAITGSSVKAYNGASGKLLGTYAGGSTLISQPLITNDLVIAASTSATYIFDKATFALRTTLPAGGFLTYTRGVLYIANSSGALATYKFQLATPEPPPAATPTPTPSATPTSTPTATPTATVTPAPTPTPTGSPGPSASPTPTPKPNPSQPLWIDAQTSGNIVYFAFAGSAPRFERFDLQQEKWLTPIELSAAPTAFAVDATGLYVSLGRSTERYKLDGSSSTHLLNTATDVVGLVISGNYLYLNAGGGHFSSANKATGTLAAAKDFFTAVQGLSVDSTHRKIFARSVGISPSDIEQIDFTATGDLGNEADSPYHGAYPGAQRTFVSPDQSKVIDDGGIVYSTLDLTYINSLNGAFADLTFAGNLPIVLRSGALIGYSTAFLETGRYQLNGTPLRAFAFGDAVFAFYQGDTRGVWTTKVPLSLLNPAQPGKPVDPNGLTYLPDSIELGKDDIVYVLSRASSSVFRWSTNTNKYLGTIPLTDAPTFMAYSKTNSALYLAYASGLITVIHPDQSLTEEPFANLPQAVKGLSTANEFVFACDASGAWATHYIFSPTGKLISSKEWNYISTEYIWSSANRKMYFFRDDTSPNDLLWENIDLEGNLGTEQDSPYHQSEGWQHPIRLSPTGSYAVLGSGRIFDAITLNQTNSLSNDITDAAWLNTNDLFTTRLSGPDGEVQSWSSTWGIKNSVVTPGAPLRLLATSKGLLSINELSGVPVFTVYDGSLKKVQQSALPAAPLGNISTRLQIGTGEQVLIGGFIITGTDSKKILLRAIGPSLKQFNVPGVLEDPVLELHAQNGDLLAVNDNWRSGQETEVSQTGLAPKDGFEAAILTILAPGFYTAIVRGNNDTTGVGLVETYDLDQSGTSKLANISTRGFVQTGDNVMIGGFIVGGTPGRATTVLLRAIGPSLTAANVSGALADPVMELRDQSGTPLAINDDWQESQKAVIANTGIPPNDPRESGILRTLPAGNYTAIVRGKDNGTGVAVIEVYKLD